MALALIGHAEADTNTVNLPAFTAGQIAIVFAYRNGSNTVPTLPAGWTNLLSSAGANTNSRRIGYRVLVGGDTTTGVWTNATSISVIVLSGQNTVDFFGSTNSGGDNTSTLTSPGMGFAHPTSDSWMVAFAGSKATNANTVTLSGTTDEGSTSGHINLATGRNIAGWAGSTYSATVNAVANRTDVIEVLVDVSYARATQAVVETAYTPVTPNARVTQTFVEVAYIQDTGADAPAEAATGAGSAQSPAASVAPNAGSAAGAGTASDPSISLSTSTGSGTGTGSAGGPASRVEVGPAAAAGLGSAYDATVTVGADVSAEAATGTGAAADPTVSVATGASVATGTGAAHDATVTVGADTSANAEAATGTGAAAAAAVSVAAGAGSASGSGTAAAPTASVAPNAAASAGTGAAGDSAASVAGSSGVATGTGSASAPSPSVATGAGAGTGTGAAYDATVAVGADTNAAAGAGAGTGAAYAIAAAIAASAASAAGTGSAYDAAAEIDYAFGLDAVLLKTELASFGLSAYMAGLTHSRLNDHFGVQDDTVIITTNGLVDWAPGTTVAQMLADMFATLDGAEAAPSGRFGLSAFVQPYFYLNAVIQRTESGSFGLDARVAYGTSFSLDAVIRTRPVGSMGLNAYIIAPGS